MNELLSLGYIGYDVTNLPAWHDFLTTLYALEARQDGSRGVRRYRVDQRHHRISVHAAKVDRVRRIGFEVADRDALERVREHLEAHGVSTRRGTAAQAAERAVLDFLAFSDPDGHRLEVFCCAVDDTVPFRPSRPHAGFVTGEGGLGHVVLHCRDADASVAWYRQLLGFGISDYIHWADARATFLHCNPRHHTLALVNECFGLKGGDFNHLMLEAREMNDVGRAWDIAQARGYPVAFTLGRHSNDNMLSFYMYTPSGHLIEYGYGGLMVDSGNWQPKYYDAPAYWGHQVQPAPKRWPVKPG